MEHYTFPVEPLVSLCVERWKPSSRYDMDISDFAKARAVLGVPQQTLRLWYRQGITWIYADRLACRLGLHPGMIWREWWHVC